MNENTSKKLNFEAPGPGMWQQDPVHFPRPMTRYYQETQPLPFKQGTRDGASFYGSLTDGIQAAYVNGFCYSQLLFAPESELPKRFKRAEEVYAQKAWREQLREWDEHYKPASIALHRELGSINPDLLSDSELVAYLKRCRDHHAAMIAQHMRFSMPAMLPTGDFLVQAKKWTGLPSSELLGLMQGASKVSSGASIESDNLKLAFNKDPVALEILASDWNPEGVLEKLRSMEGEVGNAFRAYLDLLGNRIVDGFDIGQPTLIEMPGALLRSIRVMVLEEEQASTADILIAKVRSQVPPEHQVEFDELLQEARLTYRLRDERGVYSDIWAAGLMRRAALAAGRKVANDGRITNPDQMLEASLDEMCALVLGAGPSASELAKRAEYRATHTAKEAPPTLGSKPPAGDLPDLPPSAARLMNAFQTYIGEIFESSTAEPGKKLLIGRAASKGIYEGPARCISGPSEFGRIEKGDVLVTESTSEAFNILLPLLGGIITDNGGLLSHAAIVAREYGIPGVVGTRNATERISDGARVRVDGDKGEVTVLE